MREELERFDPQVPIEQASTPPASWYTDPRFYALERTTVFHRTWQAVGPGSGYATGGSASVLAVPAGPVITYSP